MDKKASLFHIKKCAKVGEGFLHYSFIGQRFDTSLWKMKGMGVPEKYRTIF
jgi:hypothetical protein